MCPGSLMREYLLEPVLHSRSPSPTVLLQRNTTQCLCIVLATNADEMHHSTKTKKQGLVTVGFAALKEMKSLKASESEGERETESEGEREEAALVRNV